MARILGELLEPIIFGDDNAALSADLNLLSPAEYAPAIYDRPDLYFVSGSYDAYRIAASNSWGIRGEIAHSFFQDFYFRVYVVPTTLALGNLVSAQVRAVTVWNAFPNRSVELIDATLLNGEGIDVLAPGVLPIAFNSLQERSWQITVSSSGPPVIDATFSFEFTGLDGLAVRITGNRLLAWMIPPEWSNGVLETLDWLTDVQQPIEGEELRIPQRGAPRRQWEFDVVRGNRERRLLENVLFDWTSRIWALPIWTDITWLSAAMPSGVVEILLDPVGLDYRVGGLVMLWTDIQRYELVEVADLLPDRIVLLRPTVQAWPRGTRVYPCRIARLIEAPSITRKNARVITTSARFDAAEPCDWPAIAPAASYLGYPVLEHRREESEDPTASYPRQVVVIDGDVGLVEVDDISGRSWPSQSHAWVLKGRQERADHRSLLYWLQGRGEAIWIPTGTDDVTMTAPIGASSTVLNIEWCGAARYLRAQAGRCHLHITLRNGTVLHAAVTAAIEVNEQTEQLLLDENLGMDLAPGAVARICWMMLARLESDRIEIAHEHDVAGVAKVSALFVGLGDEEP